MKRYAFIDVPNTTGTTKDCLDFFIDWEKLYNLLTNKKWNCEESFFYKGYKGNKEKQQLGKIQKLGYVVKTKLTHIHPDKIKSIKIKCESCGEEFLHDYVVKGNQKSNCDVELTVDALETLSSGDEALIFTGDGDFSYLIEKLISKDVVVWIIDLLPNNFFAKISKFWLQIPKNLLKYLDIPSYFLKFSHKIRKFLSKSYLVTSLISSQKRNRYGIKRFSIRLQKIITKETKNNKRRAVFVDINDWRKSIEKENRPQA